MLNFTRRALIRTYIRFKYWRHTRLVKDGATFQVPIADLEGDVYMVTMPGTLIRVFTKVELELMYAPGWTDEHLFAFYEGVVRLAERDQLTAPKLLMFLHPEAYQRVTEFTGEPLPPELAQENFPGEDDGVAMDDDDDENREAA